MTYNRWALLESIAAITVRGQSGFVVPWHYRYGAVFWVALINLPWWLPLTIFPVFADQASPGWSNWITIGNVVSVVTSALFLTFFIYKSVRIVFTEFGAATDDRHAAVQCCAVLRVCARVRACLLAPLSVFTIVRCGLMLFVP